MAAAMLIAAATACSSEDSTKVFNAGSESTAQGSASSPGSSGAPPGNANAAGLSATRTAAAAAGSGDEAAHKTSGKIAGKSADESGGEAADRVAEKIGDIPAAPAPRPSPLLSSVPSPGLSSGPRATPSPTAAAEPAMRLARSADEPVVVDAIQPEDVPRAERVPVGVSPGAGGGTARESSSPPSRAPSPVPSRTPSPVASRAPSPAPLARPSGASAGGWGSPALAEDFGGEALRLTGGGGDMDLSGSSVQRYGRWEVRVRADEGAAPVALLRSVQSQARPRENSRHRGSRYGNSRHESSRYGSSQYGDSRYDSSQYGSSQYGDSRYGSSQYDASRYGSSQYDDSRYDDSRYGSSQYDDPGYGDSPYDSGYADPRYDSPESGGTDDRQTEDAAIGVAAIGGRSAELSVRQGREQARAEMPADFTQWHTIAVDWLPGRVTFWLDGRQVWNYTGPYVPRSEGMGLVLRNSGGGTVYVDSVRIYRAPER
ncbi:hypothetical protein ACQPZZ_16005 [Microbispora sp. CA-135349]|uniref:hypothetical protein n=1 Tax=Microbispora sp. CA-135349 TaxID=3239953 RepID=UPI003D929FBB